MNRHARHHALSQIGDAGQQRIAGASVLLIGVGGIGCAAASYLASSGVGHIVLNDFDTVDETNLGRQVLFGPGDIGESKAQVAAARLLAINPDIRVTVIDERLDSAAMAKAIREVDVVLDGCDNFATRFLVNDVCVAGQCCLVSGSAIRLEGQMAVFGPDYQTSPCYRCLYEDADESLENCAGNGVLAPVPGVIGTLMAVEALKFLAGLDAPRGRLLLYDAGDSSVRAIEISKRSDCPACS
ncbi:MAG: HesA/MoeB/ThiF family protein [Woeseiaceae bacterium]